MEWNRLKRNGIKTSFHYLSIIRRNIIKLSIDCLESGWNEINYKFFIPFLPLCKKHQYIEIKHLSFIKIPKINYNVFNKNLLYQKKILYKIKYKFSDTDFNVGKLIYKIYQTLLN